MLLMTGSAMLVQELVVRTTVVSFKTLALARE
jgi:hypothetical protein